MNDGAEIPIVMIPVHNDWEALALLLPRLDAVLVEAGRRARVLVVDDRSTAPCGDRLARLVLRAVTEVEVLTLRRNLGHQRAIAIGLTFVEQQRPVQRVVVMDGDGEDRPEDVPRLLAESERHPEAVVFAARHRRSESWRFRMGYGAYRALHRALTGLGVNVGNFSAVPASVLRQLVVVSDVWSHYAAAVYRARIPYLQLPTTRGRRLAGEPTMRVSSLTTHGLSALAVHGEQVGTRLFLGALLLSAIAALALGAVLVIRVATTWAVPGWATVAAGLAAVLLTQFIALAVLFAFLALTNRSSADFIPLRDYALFVDHVERVRLASAGAAAAPRAERATAP